MVSAYVKSGVFSKAVFRKIVETSAGKGCPPQTQIGPDGRSPSCPTKGIPCTFVYHSRASLPLVGCRNGAGVFVPVCRNPKRASLRKVGESVEVKLTVNTC